MIAILFQAPKLRPPLWAHRPKTDRNTLSWKWAISAAIVIVGAGIYAMTRIDFSTGLQPAATPVLRVAMVTLGAEVKPMAPGGQEMRSPEPPPKPKASPKKVRSAVKAPLRAPEREPKAAPVPVAPPAPPPSSESAVSPAGAVRPASPPNASAPQNRHPPKTSGGGAGEVRHSVASLVDCNPRYPSRAKHSGVSGEFVVQMTVDPSGTVTEVKIVSGGPRAMFERDIKKSMSRCRFEPTSTGFIAEVPVAFKIED
jgi:periplasmic protein TonB